MDKTMTTTSRFTDLNEFLAKHSDAKNEQKTGESVHHTHTRMRGPNVFPGSFIIPKEELDEFYDLYYESIFVKKRKEYLTEKQLENGTGPMVVDFDFRYEHSTTERIHTIEHISDMVSEYSELLKECYLIKPETPFDVFIFEKPNVNRLEDGSLTKDGIHMLIGVQVDHTMQLVIREKMLSILNNIWSDLPLLNDWEGVLDEGISKGKTNWQLFGSRKPNCEAYELTYHFVMSIDGNDNQFRMDEKDVTKFNLKKNFAKLSVQYDKNPKFDINPKIIDEYNKRLENKASKIKKASSKVKMNLIIDDEETNEDEYISINDIKDKEMLEKAVNLFLKNLQQCEYEINEIHQYTQALPEKYYEPGSHLLNRQVAFALKHTDERLFLSWVMLRSKASDFDYNSIPELYSLWKKFHNSNQDGVKVTKKSIIYWVKNDNFTEYEKIKKNTIDNSVERLFETQSGTDTDIAKILYKMYKDKYVCVSYDKKSIWYHYINHRWKKDTGLSLRSKISEELFSLIQKKGEDIYNEFNEYKEDDERRDLLQKKFKIIGEIKIKLKNRSSKDNIFREAAEVFYDDDFYRTMDTNKQLLGFKNGVIDFDNKIFREGYPEDYITKSTKINYIPFEELSQNTEYIEKCNYLNQIMEKLFPVPELNKYMWDHLSSSLIGYNKNQTFNVYHGSGGNGKSIIVDLMSAALGEYKWLVPLTLVTESRNRVGGTSDEVLKLKGIRYAVIQEPQKSVKLNEGVMKEYTGGDPIQARGLYSESEIFDPQFTLVVCTNNLFEIESNDDGTWRRIRKCDFLSKFIDEGETYTCETPYVYKKDYTLKEKMPDLAPVFASMLVKRAFETNGIVKDCDFVRNASDKYRKREDHIAAFISDKIMKTDNKKDRIKKTELIQEFKKWFEESQGSRKIPKGEELYDYMNKKFGNVKSTGWHGIKIIYPDDEEEDVIADL
jgi:P4 family phage/plasmid primase-like protien